MQPVGFSKRNGNFAVDPAYYDVKATKSVRKAGMNGRVPREN